MEVDDYGDGVGRGQTRGGDSPPDAMGVAPRNQQPAAVAAAEASEQLWRDGPEGTEAAAERYASHLAGLVERLSDSCSGCRDAARIGGITSALLLLCDVAPHVKPAVIAHCAKHPIDFAAALANDAISEREDASSAWRRPVEIAKAGYRATLTLSLEDVRHTWDWASFLKVLDAECHDARWLAVNTMAAVFQLPERLRVRIVSRYMDGNQRLRCYLAWRAEQRRLARRACGTMLAHAHAHAHHAPPGASALDIGEEAGAVDSGPFVFAPSREMCFRLMRLSLLQSRPVLVFGPTGAGKSALVDALVRRSGVLAPLTVHLHRSMDARALIGTYVCTTRAGHFEWRAGPLTIAATEGRWLVLENVGAAPQEALSIIAAAAATHTVPLPGLHATKAKPGFRLLCLATARPSAGGVQGG